MRDTFLTIDYKGFYIQTCFDNGKEEVKAFGVIQGKRFEREFKTVLSAKQWITKTINKYYK